MALTPAQKFAIRAKWGSDLSARQEAFNLNKADLDAAITAVDDWIEANAVSFNLALPLAARTTLTAAQKAELLTLVALKRFGG
mgnify:FL=1